MANRNSKREKPQKTGGIALRVRVAHHGGVQTPETNWWNESVSFDWK
jgi:hypothetical protein